MIRTTGSHAIARCFNYKKINKMKKLNTIFFVLVVLSFLVQVQAQQDPHFSLYKYNMSVINPAYAGTQGEAIGTIGARSQWVRINGAPETGYFNFNTPVGKNVGLGLNAVSDRVFVLNETHLYADFSYKLKLSETIDLYAGLKAGGSFLNIDLLDLDVENDPLFSENISNFNPNIGVGFYLQAKKYFVSVSAPGLLKGDRFEKEGVVPIEATDNIHFFTAAGYNFDINESVSLRPSAMGRFVSGAPVSIDMTLAAMLHNRFEFGANYRLSESITGFITMQFLDRIRFGYAFEHTTTDISDYSSGTHEVILKILFGDRNREGIARFKDL